MYWSTVMNFVNCTAEDLKAIFGEEGIQMISEYPDLLVVFAKKGDYPDVDKEYTPALFVSNLDEETFEVRYDASKPLGIVIYPEGVEAVMANIPAYMYKRYKMSLLVHELVHVRQAKEGRIECVSMDENIWEGELVKTKIEDYFSFPWEFEAFVEQYTYLTGCAVTGKKMAEEQKKTLVSKPA